MPRNWRAKRRSRGLTDRARQPYGSSRIWMLQSQVQAGWSIMACRESGATDFRLVAWSALENHKMRSRPGSGQMPVKTRRYTLRDRPVDTERSRPQIPCTLTVLPPELLSPAVSAADAGLGDLISC